MSRKISSLVLLVAVVAMLLAACGQAATPTPQPTAAPTQAPPSPTPLPPTATPIPPTPTPTPIVVKDDLGNTITLQAPPKRIVSLAPSITESLFAIGAGKQVVARDDNSKYPDAAAKLPSVGSLWGNFPLEAIVAQKPDLVIAAEIISPDKVKQMQDAGLTVFWVANPKTLDDLYASLRTLAKITGHEKEAEKLIAQLQERVQAVEDALKNITDEPLVFYELDATDPANPYTAGPGTFISTLIQMAKGRNVGDVLDKPWAQISTEELVKQNPDIILLADAPYGVTPESVAKRAGWGEIKAVKDGKVYPFDPNLLSVPGPRLIDGLETLAVMLHPDVFCTQDLTQHLEQNLVGAVCKP